jgi:hypothetical protein
MDTHTHTHTHTNTHTGSCNGEKGAHILGVNWFHLCRATFTYHLGVDNGETLSNGIHGVTVRIVLVVVVFGEERTVNVDVALGDLDVASRQSKCTHASFSAAFILVPCTYTNTHAYSQSLLQC